MSEGTVNAAGLSRGMFVYGSIDEEQPKYLFMVTRVMTKHKVMLTTRTPGGLVVDVTLSTVNFHSNNRWRVVHALQAPTPGFKAIALLAVRDA